MLNVARLDRREPKTTKTGVSLWANSAIEKLLELAGQPLSVIGFTLPDNQDTPSIGSQPGVRLLITIYIPC